MRHSINVDLGKQKMMSLIKEVLPLELINRVDEFVVFNPLGRVSYMGWVFVEMLSG